MSAAYEEALQRALEKWGPPATMPARYVASFADGFYEGWQRGMKEAHAAIVAIFPPPSVGIETYDDHRLNRVPLVDKVFQTAKRAALVDVAIAIRQLDPEFAKRSAALDRLTANAHELGLYESDTDGGGND
jgi:hypothetical protein